MAGKAGILLILSFEISTIGGSLEAGREEVQIGRARTGINAPGAGATDSGRPVVERI
jgi:hypothetical protein